MKPNTEHLDKWVANLHKNEPFDIYIGRAKQGGTNSFGNPYPIQKDNPNATREAVVSKLETLLLEGTDPFAQELRKNLHKLKGKVMGCFCAPALCHGHVYAHHALSLVGNEPLPIGGNVERLTSKVAEVLQELQSEQWVSHSRYPLPGRSSLEVSSHGDRRFSALFARLKDGRTIEEAYQLDVKGYRSQGNDWRIGKGKPPLKNVDLWESYKGLWRLWSTEQPHQFDELCRITSNVVLTDKFANGPISQAKALAELISEKTGRHLGLPNHSEDLKKKNTQQGLFEDDEPQVKRSNLRP